jgi:hypothetical protein
MTKTRLVVCAAGLILVGISLIVVCIPITKKYALYLPLDCSQLTSINYDQIKIVATCSVFTTQFQTSPSYYGFIDFSPFTTYVDANGTILNPVDNDWSRFKSGETLLFIATGNFSSWHFAENRTLTTYAFTWSVPKYSLTKNLIQEWLGLGFPTHHVVPNLWKKANITYFEVPNLVGTFIRITVIKND